MTKTDAFVGVIVVALCVGWLASTIKAAERRGEIRAQVEALTVERDQLTRAVTSWVARDSVLRDSLEALTLVRDTLAQITRGAQERARRARTALDSALAVESVPDTVRVVVREAVAAMGQQFEACQAELHNCEDRARVLTSQRDSAVALVGPLDSLSRAQQVAISGLIRQIRPRPVRAAVPWILATVATVVAVLK